MVFCCVPNCKSRPSTILKALARNNSRQNHEGITFHRFPHKNYIKKQWIRAVSDLAEWRPSQDACVCSIHFEPSLFRRSKNGKIFLCKSAVPRLYLQLDPSAEELPIYHEPPPMNREHQRVKPVSQPVALVRQAGKTLRRPVYPVRQPNKWKPTVQHERVTFKLKGIGGTTWSPKSVMRLESQLAPVDSEDCKITQITEEIDIDIKSECGSELSESDWERVPSPTNSDSNDDVREDTETVSEVVETDPLGHEQSESDAALGGALARVVIRDVMSCARDPPRPLYRAPVTKINTDLASTEQPKADKNDLFKPTLTFQDVFKSNINFTETQPSQDKTNAVKSRDKSNTVKGQDKNNTVKTQDKSNTVNSQAETISTQTTTPSLDKTHINDNNLEQKQELLPSQHIIPDNAQCLTTNVNSNVVYISMPHLKPVQFQELPSSVKKQLKQVQSQPKSEHQEYSVSKHSYQDLPYRPIRPKPIDHQDNQKFSISRHRYQDLPYRKIKPKSNDQNDQTVHKQLTASFEVKRSRYKKLTNTNIVKLEYLPEPSECSDPSRVQSATVSAVADPLATRDCCDRATSPIHDYKTDVLIEKQQTKIDRLTNLYKQQRLKIKGLNQKLSRKEKKISTLFFCLEKTKLSTSGNPIVLTTPSNMPNQNNITNQNYLVVEPINVNESGATKQNTIVVEPLTKSTHNTYVPYEPDPTPDNTILESLLANTDNNTNNNMVVSSIAKPSNPLGRPQQNDQVNTTPITTNEVKTTTTTDVENPSLVPSDEEIEFPSPTNSEEDSASNTDDGDDNSDEDNYINDDVNDDINNDRDNNGDNDKTGVNKDDDQYIVPTPVKSLKRPNHTKFIIQSDSTEEQGPARKKTRKKPSTNDSDTNLSTSANRSQQITASKKNSTQTTTNNKTQPITSNYKTQTTINNKTQPTTNNTTQPTTSNYETQTTINNKTPTTSNIKTQPTANKKIKLINSKIIKPSNSNTTQLTTSNNNPQRNKTQPTTSNYTVTHSTSKVSKPTVNVVFQPGRMKFISPTTPINFKNIPRIDKVIKTFPNKGVNPNILVKNSVRLPTIKIASKTPASPTPTIFTPLPTYVIPTSIVVSKPTPTLINVRAPEVRKVVVNPIPMSNFVVQQQAVRSDGNVRGPMENEI